MIYGLMKLECVIKDYRDYTCMICKNTCRPALRFCYSLDHEDIGDLLDSEMEICEKCANKECKGWKRFFQS